MRALILTVTISILASLATRAEDDIRIGEPKECFLFSFGKGPNWTARISSEFRLAALNHRMPYVDDSYSDPTEKALTWVERTGSPQITTIAMVNGRKVLQIIYPQDGVPGTPIGHVLLAIETAKDSAWYSPFFAAQPEIFTSQFVSSTDLPFGYIVTLAHSGTGAFRTHYLFDLRSTDPKILATVSAGRVSRVDYDSEAEYERAKKVYEDEKALFSGTLPRKEDTKP